MIWVASDLGVNARGSRKVATVNLWDCAFSSQARNAWRISNLTTARLNITTDKLGLNVRFRKLAFELILLYPEKLQFAMVRA